MVDPDGMWTQSQGQLTDAQKSMDDQEQSQKVYENVKEVASEFLRGDDNYESSKSNSHEETSSESPQNTDPSENSVQSNRSKYSDAEANYP